MIGRHFYATWKSFHEDEKSNHFTLRVVTKGNKVKKGILAILRSGESFMLPVILQELII